MNGLEQIYMVSGAIGFIYVVGSALMGHIGEHDHGGGHGHHGVHDHGGHHGGHGHSSGVHHSHGHAGSHGGSHGHMTGGHHTVNAGSHGSAQHGPAAHGHDASHQGHDSGHHDDSMKSSKAELATTFTRKAPKSDASSSFFFLMMRFLNPMRIALILFLFGLTGFLTVKAMPILGPLSLVPAALIGVFASNVVLALLGKLVSKLERSQSYRKEDAIGTVGHLTVPIMENGTGEVVFVCGGSKTAAPARAFETGTPISKLSKVIISDIRDGVYFVEPWDEESGVVLKVPQNESAS